MTGEHPKLTRAIEALEAGNPGPLVAISLRSDEDTCRCLEPILEGMDLMCRRCLHRNPDQVRRRIDWAKAPHEFVPRPGKSGIAAEMCDRCTGWRDDDRHTTAGGEQ